MKSPFSPPSPVRCFVVTQTLRLANIRQISQKLAKMSPPQSALKRGATEDRPLSPPPIKRKQQSTTTSKAVANFFKPTSQKEPERVTWQIVDQTLLVGKHHVSEENKVPVVDGKQKIAAFDFDSTLISTKSTLRFARDASDWQWWNTIVPTELRRLHDEGYLLAIISNQKGISLRKDSKTAKGDMKSLSNFKNKAAIVFARLDLPISIYAATEQDQYRKPRVGMWKQLLENYGLKQANLDLEASIFVGDAAGRGEVKRGGDHSCSDRDFAANVGIPFKTPEEYFLKEDPKPFHRVFDPITFLNMPTALDTTSIVFSKTNPVELVIFHGSPGSGKSSFYWKHLKPLGYERVNQDILKTRDKCLKIAEEYLSAGKPVAVDNTNRDVDTRAFWVNLAKKYSVPIRCVYFTASTHLCEHNDRVRALGGDIMNPEKRTILPMSAFSSFASSRQEPTSKEGFEDITKVDFVFEGSDEQKTIWSRYWI